MRDCLVRFLLGWISRGSGDRQGFSLDNDMLHAYTEGETNENDTCKCFTGTERRVIMTARNLSNQLQSEYTPENRLPLNRAGAWHKCRV